MQSTGSVTVQDAIEIYFNGFKRKDDQLLAQQELFRFARWFGQSRPMSDLRPYEIEEYGEQVGGAGTRFQAAERIQAVRSFLSFAKKKELRRDEPRHAHQAPQGTDPAWGTGSRAGAGAADA